jgi:hypothetical protein
MIAQSRVIAKGRRIRYLTKLLEKYGGKSSRWIKKSSPTFNVNDELYEYHWYEHYGIGKFEIKLKKVSKK